MRKFKMPNFEDFEKKANLHFKNKTLLKTALTHRSFMNENRGVVPEHNERLEFLGDAVLELISSEYLFGKYPEKPEGELTAIRAALVNTDSIADAARKLGMNDYLLLSKGESKDTGRARHFILANAFEALLGAIYLDRGYEAAREFVAENILYKTDEIVKKRLWQDPKSRLQEIIQEKESITPSYKLLKEVGPDHDKSFLSAVYAGEKELARGQGRSKQESEQEAARNALSELDN